MSARRRCTNHFAAESLADRLMAEADAENWNGLCRLADELETDAGFVRRAGAGRQHDRIGLRRYHVGARGLVISTHDDIRPQAAQVMVQVEGEAVVVVDQNDHISRS